MTSDISVAFNLVTEFFDGNSEKTLLWFRTANPLLGNVTPQSMVGTGGECQKLLKFIRTQLEENKLDILDQCKDRTEGLIDS